MAAQAAARRVARKGSPEMGALLGDFLSDWQIWLIIALILGVVELLTLSFFLIWPALGALLVSILTMIFPAMGLAGQLIAFSLFSIVTIMPGRRWLQWLREDKPKSGLNERSVRLIGQSGIIVSGEKGRFRVKIGDSEWAARSDADFTPGDKVLIKSVDGAILHVAHAKR